VTPSPPPILFIASQTSRIIYSELYVGRSATVMPLTLLYF
jgi:hypothetical protein